MGKGIYAHPTPNPSFVSANDNPSAAVTTAPGLDVNLAAIKGGDVAKKIEFSGTISFNASAETVTITCERDGTPIGQSFLVGDTVIGGVRSVPVTLHWVDSTPGKAAPVYTINLTAAIGGVATLVSYTLTASNL